MGKIISTVLLCSIFWFKLSYAVLKIDINQGTLEPMPIAVAGFAADSWDEKQVGRDIVDVVLNDLENSGLFRAIDRVSFLEEVSMDKPLGYHNWRKINAVAVIGGAVQFGDQNQVSVQFKIWDPYKEAVIEGMSYQVQKKSWRRLAHKIADRIYQKMTGESGYFDTRILFVSHLGRGKNTKKRLAIMDQDGANFKLLTDGKHLVLTPRFDPKNQRAIYMSYEHKVPHVYILDIERGWQRLVGHFKGISFSPRFSPDGNYAIMSVANYGSTNIFEINLEDGKTTKLTRDIGAINTSPSYSPDGSKIVFNSDRAGRGQIYIMNRNGSDITKISSGSGTYATPVWSPRGDFIAFTKIEGGTFYIGVMRPDGSGERLLTTSWLDEGPTWSPNGRVIMFTRQKPDGTSNIYSIDVTGYNERLISVETDASDPAWSPLLK
ncbi:MAG: Tol-Pal system beta propeller repeat protein TolB [Candidatus Midichloria mitochondrii]|uniref:Tol-Pal system protein TolB n=1 Tax=Midichloria mitochondrii (strain IricVA) TaxID=696127 RepID=F7XWJ6_MIDMI|nr:Tol-Pal system beta propeller repeat protein TolB [Candidatus Midichloria mitochondrii]AEI89045.1 translocation protein TolB [Candidatus Midichloria mitochondrii IricVA]MDJ1255908.1 Tol-Pal system beta propeller repeat protein TolB [Candidatus Midichloria mitochondrii]MDJ1287647.1 Tol-Pal system beta propeller repeat protein TolB [Candidatus Midichloria mitochondrii]MDJ1298470.1 Tol-Pal system beta propeller repeat protein TolB [Candidatus Midichloria mitochondrii]MDJ1312533.1 Tol-Pal syste